jgi:hypothetical protein
MTATLQTLLPLLAVLVVAAVVARHLNTAPSILLVIAGIGLALAPGLPRIELAPEFVLLFILPPLIYSAGVAMSWREFRFNLRPITLLAFGCVVFTTCAVAAVANWLLGMPIAVAFVLGAIVAPPGVVAPAAIARRLGLPRRLIVVLEGDGLANDATALILYRFAVAAVSTGQFSFRHAAGTFAPWGDEPVVGVTPKYILELRDGYADVPPADSELATKPIEDYKARHASANNLLRALSAMFAWSILRDWRTDNPCDHVPKLKGGESYARWLMRGIEHFRKHARPVLWVATHAPAPRRCACHDAFARSRWGGACCPREHLQGTLDTATSGSASCARADAARVDAFVNIQRRHAVDAGWLSHQLAVRARP